MGLDDKLLIHSDEHAKEGRGGSAVCQTAGLPVYMERIFFSIIKSSSVICGEGMLHIRMMSSGWQV